MAKKLTDFTTPTGAKGNLFDIGSIWSMVLGSAIFLLTFAVGQNLLGMAGARAPFLDTQIEKPYRDPQPTNNSNRVEVL